MYKRFFKRFFDIVLSTAAIVILAVPMLIIAVIIKLDTPGPALFKQKRVGLHKTYFWIYKFRSMPEQTPSDIPTHLFDAISTLSKWQRLLRRSSLDELPQLFNVLFGAMSIVGPRPALWNQYDLIAERDKYGANELRPGVTGWAQINGRDELTIVDKARLDGEYVKRIGLFMDCKCFIGTVFSVLRHDGVVEGGTGISEATAGKELNK